MRVRGRAEYFRPPFLYAGLYARHLERWFSAFPRERFFITSSEELWRADQAKLHEIVRWLGLEVPEGNLPHERRAERPPPPPELVQRLHDYYREPNQQLSELLGWRPGWA